MKIDFVKFLWFCCFFTNLRAKACVEELIRSVMEYYRCRSVIFILNENKDSSNHKFLQFRKSLNIGFELNFISYMTLTTFSKSVKLGQHGGKKSVVVLEQNEEFLNGSFARLTQETSIASYKWLILAPTIGLSSYENLKIPLMTEFIVATENAIGYEFTEIYETEPGRKMTNFLGLWFPGKKILTKDLYDRRKDFKNSVISVVTSSLDPCNEISFATDISTIVVCIHQSLWNCTEEILNARTKIILVPRLNVETIETVNADLSLRSAPMHGRKFDTREYTWPVFATPVYIFASYTGQDIEWKTYIRPFSKSMWSVIALWILIGDLIMAFSEFLASFVKKTKRPMLSYCSKYSFLSIFAFCNQGVSDVPTLFSIQLIFFLIFVVPSVLVPGYSAVLTSFITVQLPNMPFTNLEELTKLPEYDLGWHKSLPFQILFNASDKRPIIHALLKNNVLPQEQLPPTDTEGIERMCNSKFSYISNLNTITALKPKCKYYKLDQHFIRVYTSMEMKKNSYYIYFFNRSLRNMQFNGVFTRIVINAVIKYFKPKDYTPEHKDVSPIMMENCVMPFTVLGIFMILSSIIFVFEILHFKKKQKYKKNREWGSRYFH